MVGPALFYCSASDNYFVKYLIFKYQCSKEDETWAIDL